MSVEIELDFHEVVFMAGLTVLNLRVTRGSFHWLVNYRVG
jgi:hypothetical protein